MAGKSDKSLKQSRSAEKNIQSSKAATSKQPNVETLQDCSVSVPNDGSTKKQTAENVRKKPIIQLPQKPQLPSNTQRLNPHYNYQTISSIKSSYVDNGKDLRVNLFGVVKEIIKPVETTKTNKFRMVCELIDDSDEENGEIKFHFFPRDDTIIKEIEPGDVVRLHRVKIESFNGEIDGRVFFSQDIVLFKKNSSNNKPITVAKNTSITDEEIKRVETLKDWYTIEYYRKVTLLSDICKSGNYRIYCKVVSEPEREGNIIRVKITDGTTVNNLKPSLPLKRYKREKKEHIVTIIFAHENLDEYSQVKVDDFVFFPVVEAVNMEDNKFQLHVRSPKPAEVAIGKNLQAVDINWRIEQSQRSTNTIKQIKSTDTSFDLDVNEFVSKVNAIKEAIENKSNIIPGGSVQEKETEVQQHANKSAVQTRLQKNQQITSQVKNTEKQVSSSCAKLKSNLLITQDHCDIRNTECDLNAETFRAKMRKQLFTPNYRTDLSDATDETSENLEVGQTVSENPNEDIVNPADTNFNDIVEKVKTKYCSPKSQDQQTSSIDVESPDRQLSSRKRRDDGKKLPIVLVDKLSGSDANSCSRPGAMKRSQNISDSHEDMTDASTVINVSYQTTVLNHTKQGNKRIRLESLLTEEGNTRGIGRDVDHEIENRGHKVSSWLFHPNNKIVTQQEDVINDELDLASIKQILCCDNHSPDMSKYISSLFFRTQAFLIEVIPDPSINPLDLVSGYCYAGCHQMFLFSKLLWHHESDASIPLCPDCARIEQKKELQLMFIMELHVMDTNGRHSTVLALRDHAEQFLNCAVHEFVRDPVVRKSRVQLLTDYTTQNTLRCDFTPLLDIAVAPVGSIICLVNSTLKLPSRI